MTETRRDGSDGEVWQEIAMAPKDGHAVIGLLWDGTVHPVFWTPVDGGYWKWAGDGWFSGAAPRLTHWMPLPDPPAAPVRDVARLRGEPTPKETAEMSDTSRGLYNKYRVERTDGSSGPNGKHSACEYYVLDLTHDDFALPALIAYEMACREKYPALADDLALKIQQMKALRGTFFSGGVR